MHATRPLFALTLILAGFAAPARAGAPSAVHSTVDPCLVTCPAGDVSFAVTVRDASGQPVPFSAVVVDFCDCSEVVLCPVSPTDNYDRLSPCRIRRIADGAGRATFQIRAGGVCSGAAARVFADGVLIATRNVASSDQNGDDRCDALDQQAWNTKFFAGNNDPTADFNCDGFVALDDASILSEHDQHACPPAGPAPVPMPGHGKVALAGLAIVLSVAGLRALRRSAVA